MWRLPSVLICSGLGADSVVIRDWVWGWAEPIRKFWNEPRSDRARAPTSSCDTSELLEVPFWRWLILSLIWELKLYIKIWQFQCRSKKNKKFRLNNWKFLKYSIYFELFWKINLLGKFEFSDPRVLFMISSILFFLASLSISSACRFSSRSWSARRTFSEIRFSNCSFSS